MDFCHSKGVTLGEQLSPDKIFVQEDGWLRLVLPITQWKPKNDDAIKPLKSKESPSINNTKASTTVMTSDLEEEPNPINQRRSIFHINGDASFAGERGDRGVTIIPYPGKRVQSSG